MIAFYGADGRQIKQISDHAHGKRNKHPFGKNGEHAHDYSDNKDGTLERGDPRELTNVEIKENGDLL